MAENIVPEHQNVTDRISGIYEDYMFMIRTFICEDIIELAEPTDVQRRWAHMAAMGDPELAQTIAQLARVTEVAFKQRFLDEMPMLNDFDSPLVGEHNGFDTIERFHFLRLFCKDFRANKDAQSPKPGVPAVFYIDENRDIV